MNKKMLNKMAISATLHCLIGCSIGEIAGMTIGAWLDMPNSQTVILSTILAFISGYTLSVLPLVRLNVPFKKALRTIFAADTLSILTMEIVDNLVMVVVPGAMGAGLLNPIFWLTMPISLAVAFVVTVPVNRYLLQKGKGHALVHEYHSGHSHGDHGYHH